jgi:hypothetical protein
VIALVGDLELVLKLGYGRHALLKLERRQLTDLALLVVHLQKNSDSVDHSKPHEGFPFSLVGCGSA